MAHVVIALTRQAGSWTGRELEISADDDLDTLGEAMTEDAESVEVALLLVEENDEWFAVIRWDDLVDGLVDPRIFISDRRVIDTSDIAERLLADALPVAAPSGDADEDAGGPEIEPAGDVALLADLGTSGDRLIELTLQEGLLPADALAAIGEAAGAAEALDAARG